MRSVIAVLTLALFLLMCWSAGRAGYARSLADTGRENYQTAWTETAVRLAPSDPETHYNRATLFWSFGNTEGAVAEAERAAALRPRDYYLWFRLGFYRYNSDDEAGALAPFEEASRLAPYYAQPHWYIGNILLRAGRREEAFDELRRATASDPRLVTDAVTLIGEALNYDPQAIERAFPPRNDGERLALAHYFARRGKAAEAKAMFRSAGGVSQDERRAFVTDLLAYKQFSDAYEIWSEGRGSGDKSGQVSDGGFEGKVIFNDSGFGWQLAKEVETVHASLDTDQPRSGGQSLRLDFNGNSNPAARIVSQMVLVAPNSRYRLRFAARAQKLVTGGPPVVAVADASGGDFRALAQSAPIPQDTGGWKEYAVEFATPKEAGPVLVFVQRQSCSSEPCPVFGSLWLDDFSLAKL